MTMLDPGNLAIHARLCFHDIDPNPSMLDAAAAAADAVGSTIAEAYAAMLLTDAAVDVPLTAEETVPHIYTLRCGSEELFELHGWRELTLLAAAIRFGTMLAPSASTIEKFALTIEDRGYEPSPVREG